MKINENKGVTLTVLIIIIIIMMILAGTTLRYIGRDSIADSATNILDKNTKEDAKEEMEFLTRKILELYYEKKYEGSLEEDEGEKEYILKEINKMQTSTGATISVNGEEITYESTDSKKYEIKATVDEDGKITIK